MKTGNQAGAMRALRYLRKEGPQDWYRVMTGPTKGLQPSSAYTNTVAAKTGVGRLSQKIMMNVLRPFVAADKVGTEALRRVGFSKAESERLMLMGEPTTWQGQVVLGVAKSNLLFRLLAKFPAVRIGGFERAIEFTPGLNKKYSTRHDLGAGQKFGYTNIPQEKLSAKQLKARGQFGAAAFLGASAYGYYRDPGIAESSVVASAAGPAAIPFGAGVTLGKSLRRGKPGIMEALSSVSSSLPQINEQDILGLPNRLVPLRPLTQALKRLGLLEE